MVDFKNDVRGFSLVELAISITVIGVLIAGIIKGQEIVDNSRIVSTTSKVARYSSATLSFEDLFGQLPGDMDSPETKIPLCAQLKEAGSGCTYTADNSQDGDGDNKIEGIWDVEADDDSDEGRGFWEHLAASSILTDTKYAPGTTNSFGTTHPRAPFGGGFTVMRNPGVTAEGYIASGNFFRMSRTQTSFGDEAVSLLTPLLARTIDRKIDDGKPDAGKVLGSTSSTCVSSGEYDISTTSRDCDLLFKFM